MIGLTYSPIIAFLDFRAIKLSGRFEPSILTGSDLHGQTNPSLSVF